MLLRSTSSTTVSSSMVPAHSGWARGNQETSSRDRSHTRRSPTPVLPVPPRPPHVAAARQNAARSRSTPSCAICSSTLPSGGWTDSVTCSGAWLMSSACAPGCSTAPVDVTRLSEHILRVTDVLCLSSVTIRGLVRDWLDAKGLDVRPSKWWVNQLLHGMRLSCKQAAKCVKELHNPEQQHAHTRTGSSSSCAG